jgi:hypothetical protein
VQTRWFFYWEKWKGKEERGKRQRAKGKRQFVNCFSAFGLPAANKLSVSPLLRFSHSPFLRLTIRLPDLLPKSPSPFSTRISILENNVPDHPTCSYDFLLDKEESYRFLLAWKSISYDRDPWCRVWNQLQE